MDVTGDVMEDESLYHGDRLGDFGGVYDLGGRDLLLFHELHHGIDDMLHLLLTEHFLSKLRIFFADVVGTHHCSLYEGAQIVGNERGKWRSGKHGTKEEYGYGTPFPMCNLLSIFMAKWLKMVQYDPLQ